MLSKRKQEILGLITEGRIKNFHTFFNEYLCTKGVLKSDEKNWADDFFSKGAYLVIPLTETEAAPIIDEYIELIDGLVERRLIRIIPSSPIPISPKSIQFYSPDKGNNVMNAEIERRIKVHIFTEYLAYRDALEKYKNNGYKTDEEEKFDSERKWYRRWLPLAISVISILLSLWTLWHKSEEKIQRIELSKNSDTLKVMVVDTTHPKEKLRDSLAVKPIP